MITTYLFTSWLSVSWEGSSPRGIGRGCSFNYSSRQLGRSKEPPPVPETRVLAAQPLSSFLCVFSLHVRLILRGLCTWPLAPAAGTVMWQGSWGLQGWKAVAGTPLRVQPGDPPKCPGCRGCEQVRAPAQDAEQTYLLMGGAAHNPGRASCWRPSLENTHCHFFLCSVWFRFPF